MSCEQSPRSAPPIRKAAALLDLFLAIACLALAHSTRSGQAQAEEAITSPAVLTRLRQFEEAGKFAEADALAAASLAGTSLSPATATYRQVEFERERLWRIRQDYPLSRDELAAAVRSAVRDLTDAEFSAWLKAGRFDGRPIDGSVRYLKVSVSNLFFRHPELESRRLRPRGNPALARAMWTNAMAIRDAARSAGRPYVLPKQFSVHMALRLKPDAWSALNEPSPARAWLPLPRQSSVQDNLRIVRSEPARYTLAPPESSIRSIYFERMLPSPTTNAAVEFTVDYEYRAHGVWFDLTPEKSQPLSPGETELAQFLKEAPHVEFSPAMRRLSQQLEGSETNPVRRAKRFYDWIAGHIRYSFAPEYSTIRNLSEFCLSRGYGDCGMEALLFMTLCRMNGIPARWQSGWSIFPGAETIHDWCEIYLAPWGWVPVDPYMGIYASQYTPTLTAQQRQELSDFYFGGLTQFRMTANSDHNQALVPAKGSFRSDDVDFQRGEVDIGGRNVYFNQQTFDFKFWILDFALDSDLDYLLD